MSTAVAPVRQAGTGFTLQRPAVNPWIIAMTVTLATFMELLDTSIANVSLPYIAGGLGRSYDEVTWILTTYLVANAVVLPLSAWLSRVIGRKNYYLLCVALFTATSFLCGVAPSLEVMLLARVLQGIGGGGLAPVEQAILVDTFPPDKRAGAFALYTMAIVTAPAIGPVLGGWITDNYNWRWIFFINIPVGLLSMALTSRFVQDPASFADERKTVRTAAGKVKVDGIGIALIGVGSGALEVMLDRGEIDDWFGSKFILTMFVVGVGCILSAVVWELRQEDPVIEFRLLRIRNFAIANMFYFVFGFGLFASTTMIPQILQSLYGYRAIDAGLVLGPGAFVITLLAPIGAQVLQRRWAQPRYVLFVAVLIVASSFFYYSSFNLATDYSHYAWARALQGLGYAFFFVPLTMIAYSYLKPNQNNKASSLTNFFRNWGGSFGIAFINMYSDRRAELHQTTMGANLNAPTPAVQERVHSLSAYFAAHGLSPADSAKAAYQYLYSAFQAQVHLLAFMDCFRAIALVTLLAAPVVLLTKAFKIGGGTTAGH